MTRTQPLSPRTTRRLLVAAAVLEAASGALGIAGLALCTVAITSMTRRRVARMEIPPTQLARRQWARARAATTAGTVAWRDVPAGLRAGARRDREPSRLA